MYLFTYSSQVLLFTMVTAEPTFPTRYKSINLCTLHNNCHVIWSIHPIRTFYTSYFTNIGLNHNYLSPKDEL